MTLNKKGGRGKKDMASIPATLIPGDGIGPEVTDATLQVLEAVGAPFAWETHKAGMAGIEAWGEAAPPQTIGRTRKTSLALQGAPTPPDGEGIRAVYVR